MVNSNKKAGFGSASPGSHLRGARGKVRGGRRDARAGGGVLWDLTFAATASACAHALTGGLASVQGPADAPGWMPSQQRCRGAWLNSPQLSNLPKPKPKDKSLSGIVHPGSIKILLNVLTGSPVNQIAIAVHKCRLPPCKSQSCPRPAPAPSHFSVSPARSQPFPKCTQSG